MKEKSSNGALPTIFERILEDLEPLLPFSAAGVFLEEADMLRLIVARRELSYAADTTVPVANAPSYQLLQKTKHPILQGELNDETCDRCILSNGDVQGWMVIPFIAHEVVSGVIVFANTNDSYRRSDAHLAQTFINQAASLLEKAQLADSLTTEKRNIELLYELSQNLIETLDLRQVAERAVLLTTRVLGVEFGEIMLINPAMPNSLHLFANVDYGQLVTPERDDYPFLQLGQGTAGWAALHRTPVIAPDVQAEPSWIALPGVTDEVQSTTAIPLVAHDELIGVLQLSSSITGFFQPEMLPMLQAVAAPVAIAIQNARLFAAEQKRYEVTEALRISTSTLILDLDLPDLLHKLLERMQQVVPFDSTTCFLLTDDLLHAVATLGLPKPEEVINRSFPIDEMVKRLMSQPGPVFYEDATQLPGFCGWGGTHQVRGWMMVPLVHRGQFIGYISLDSLQPGAYGSPEAEVAQAFANQAATTIVNAQLLQESRRTAEDQWTVSQIVRRLNATSTLDAIMPAIVWGMHPLTQCNAVEFVLFNGDGPASVARHTYTQTGDGIDSRYSFSLGDSRAAQSNVQGQIFQIDSESKGEMLRVETADIGQGFQTQLAVPLQVNERVLGSLRLLWKAPSPPVTVSGTVIAQIADAVAMTTEKNLLFSQTRQRIQEMETINQLAAALRPLESQSAILDVSLSFVQKTIDCHVVRLCLFDSNNQLTLAAEVGKPTTTLRTFPCEGSIFGYITQTGQPYLSSDYLRDPLAHQEIIEDWLMQGAQPRAAIFAPVFAGSTVMGVISGYNLTDERAYTQEDLHLMTTIAGIIGTALHRSSVLDSMEQHVVERTRQLAEANERLQELDRLKSEFIANVSHELRTPLTNIRFYIDLLRRGRADKHDEYLQTLQAETQQLNALIESVLDLSRLSAARLQGLFFEVTNFDLVNLLHDICHLYERQAHDKGIHLICHEISESLQIHADRSQISQVIATVLANAIAYTDPGGQVEVSAHLSHNNGIQVAVRDNGIGIPAHEIPHLFERFFRGAQAAERGIPGAGLGLSIVKEILDLHSGTIHIESEASKGTLVDIWLPRTRLQPNTTNDTIVPLFN